MAVSAGMIAKAAATVLSNEKLRKGVGWTLVAILSPIIVLIALLCSIGSGGADHNNQAVAASFYGVSYEDFIRANWLGGRTTDCVGLIKGYGWLSPETMTIDYGTHGMPDIGANQMYYSATESGTIDTMPDIPGLAVWHDGHIGVYIGGGQVIEAMGTKYGVVKTELANRGWTHWLKIPYINYD